MKISVIVPFLNEAHHLEQCIKALLNQDFLKREYEMIFVNNGSRDRSAELVRGHPALVLLEEPTPGAYAARNRGLSVARGELIAFTDADCVPATDWLTQISAGMARTGAAIVLGKWRFVHQRSDGLRLCEDYENARIAHILRQCAAPHAFAFTNNMAIRADVIRALGPFVEWDRGGDTEYLQRYLAQFPRAKAAYLQDMVVTHLEMNRLRRWLGKQSTYGWSMKRITRKTPYRPLGYWQRFQVYRACVRTHRYAVSCQIYLLGVLGLGLICFAWGRMQRFFEERVAEWCGVVAGWRE